MRELHLHVVLDRRTARLVIFGAAFLAPLNLGSESLTVVTSYPAPAGIYNSIVTVGNGPANTILAKTAGNVGIGTTNPLYKLDVAGQINTSVGVSFNGSVYANPDYVFDPDFKLAPLAELRAAVASQRHLPNVPSTQQVRKQGVEIFEQNRVVLENLEKAYLYIFQLEDRIKRLEAKTSQP